MNMRGLTDEEVTDLQEKFGKNELVQMKKENFLNKVIHTICQPMFILLLIASIIYFILGNPSDGSIMLIFIIAIISIDVIQEWKTDKTLKKLKELSAPHIKVIRDGKEKLIQSSDLVPGDLMIIEEGTKIPADGFVIRLHDLCIDESSLTGESTVVWKKMHDEKSKQTFPWRNDYCYAGTLVTNGSAIIWVDKIGLKTEYGKIGKNIKDVKKEKTPLEKQINKLIKICALLAVALMLITIIITFTNLNDYPFKSRIIQSILSGITLAMAMIPEEFPVVLTVFLSMGAWRLAKKKSLVRKLPSVETLGAVSVLCVDKTGTITMNEMQVKDTFAWEINEEELLKTMGLACETNPYDPMEKAMLNHCYNHGLLKKDIFIHKFVKEYSFTDEMKMMGHVWNINNKNVLTLKGSPEHVLEICNFNSKQKEIIEQKILEMSENGLRVIAIASETLEKLPEKITDCKVTFKGLIGLMDPPRENIEKDIKACNNAGIRVVMITGDNGITASSIAKKIGMENCGNIITGDMLDKMNDEELKKSIQNTNIFSRVIPQHKMRIVKAFKENGEIVAMTGDGVNDAPALKMADIGIAMGMKGSEVSREAADLILMDDNFSTIIDTIKDGRRIYDNIKKAISYILIIHIPIALSALLAPLLGISQACLLLMPVHIVLLELIIDPTSSLVFERQPAEKDIMSRKPRKTNETIINMKIIIKSVFQGLGIFIGSFILYYYVLTTTNNDNLARTMGLSVIMISNLLLILVNSSDKDFIFTNVKNLFKDKIIISINLVTIIGLCLIIYSPLNQIFKFTTLSLNQVLIVLMVAILSVIWYEIVKVFKQKNA